MSVTLNNNLPATIPLPFVDYGGEPRNTTLVGEVGVGVIDRRSRFTKSYTAINVVWNLTVVQFDIFKDFFEIDLGNGAARFGIELRYPKNSELTTWEVRFIEEGYDAEWIDGIWKINAVLDLVQPVELDPIAALVGFEGFLVLGEESGEGFIPFLVEGEAFNVTEE